MVLLAACGESDLDPTAQGACSNLSNADCMANASCQLLFSDGGQTPVTPDYCIALKGQAASADTCPDRVEDCRMRADCSPVYTWPTGPVDEPLPGDPVYKGCELTQYLLDNTIWSE